MEMGKDEVLMDVRIQVRNGGLKGIMMRLASLKQ